MNDQTVLVTGGAGYIGSHVCKLLALDGYTPIVYDNFCSGNAGAVRWGPLEHGDVRDRDRLKEVMKKYRPAAILHFAALIQTGRSVIDPTAYYHNNVYGTLCLLDEAVSHGIEHMVFSSTAAVYGHPGTSPIPENAALMPISPYGRTKMMMERMIEDYAAAYGLRYAILRYFNAAGADLEMETGTAYKHDTHLIPLLMQVACGMSSHIKLFGQDYETSDGTAIRDYIHVMDLAQAHILALRYIASGKKNLTVNIGTGKGYSVMDVIESARRVTRCAIPVHPEKRRAGDPAKLVADTQKAKDILGCVPACSDLDTIIETAWRWRQCQNEHKAAA